MEEENKTASKGKGGGGDQEGITKALFGALYTLAKEKFSDSAKVALLNVFVDFVLILVIFLHLEFPWAVNPDSG
jgi:hypothetical protein